jgi:glycosyltransferase involved in cell wall biosynthesis
MTHLDKTMTPAKNPELSIVLPCYNEARGIEAILKRFEEVRGAVDCELILVDNGSKDHTPEVMRTLLPRFPMARSVRVEQNIGYGHGLWSGLCQARGEILAWSHADLQTDLADVFRALKVHKTSRRPEKLLVKGSRSGRRFSERVITWGMQVVATCLLRTWLFEINAQPKLFHRSLLNHLPTPPIDFNFDVYALYQAKKHGWTLQSIPVVFPPRQYGSSNWASTWKSKARTILRSMRFMARLAFAPHLLPPADPAYAGDPTVADRERKAA